MPKIDSWSLFFGVAFYFAAKYLFSYFLVNIWGVFWSQIIVKRYSIKLWCYLIDNKFLSSLQHKTLSGSWEVSWKVKSQSFEPLNKTTARLYFAFGFILFEESAVDKKTGISIPYLFLGRFYNGKTIIGGEWFDARYKEEGYFGYFQLKCNPTSHEFNGTWIGFSKSEKVKSGELSFIKKP